MTGMTEHRFAEILASYGADPARWPDAERAAAHAFAARPEAAPLLADARALDLALAAWSVAPAGRDLVESVLAAALRAGDVPRLSVWRRFWPQLAGMATACVVGFIAGAVAIPTVETGQMDAATVAFDGGVTSNMLALELPGNGAAQ